MIVAVNFHVNGRVIRKGTHLSIIGQSWSSTFGQNGFIVRTGDGFEFYTFLGNLLAECEWPAYRKKIRRGYRKSLGVLYPDATETELKSLGFL